MPKETTKRVTSSTPPRKISARGSSAYRSPALSSVFRPVKKSAPAPAQTTLPLVLDTSEQLPLSAYYEGNVIQSKEKIARDKKKLIQTLSNRSRAKFVTSLVSVPLSKLASPLQKQYKLTERCSGELTETPGKLSGLYCGCRWCLVCSRIRTARLISGYLPAIEKMGEKWFLTLSRPNVSGPKLKAEIKYYLREASLIQRYLREKRKLKYSSLRKIECTYNEVADTFHPHFHFVFDSFEAADLFLTEWLSRNPTAKLDKGNQLKECDNNAVLELFKYFTKVVSKTKSKTANGLDSSSYRIHLAALDTMFQAMRAVRTFQPCGVIKAVSEDVEPTQTLETDRFGADFWEWSGHDWLSRETGQTLTGYVPSEGIQDISNHLVYPLGVAPVVEPAAPLVPLYFDRQTGEVVPADRAHLARQISYTCDNFGALLPVNEKSPSIAGRAFSELPSARYEPTPCELLGPWPCRAMPELPASLPIAFQAALVAVFLEAKRREQPIGPGSNPHHSTADKTSKMMPAQVP